MLLRLQGDFMAHLRPGIFFSLVVAIFVSGIEAQSKLDSAAMPRENNRAQALMKVGTGTPLVFLGCALSIGGAAAVLALRTSEVLIAGGGTAMGGIALMGLGGGLIDNAAASLDKNYKSPKGGWKWYLLGAASMGAGGYFMSTSLDDKDPGGAIIGLTMFVAGVGCEALSWGLFFQSALNGRQSVESHSSIALEPLLLFPRDSHRNMQGQGRDFFPPGEPVPGLRLAYRF